MGRQSQGTADVVTVANTFAFERLPKSVLKNVAYVILDEDFSPVADAIGELSTDAFRKATIERWPALLGNNGEVDAEATDRTIHIVEKDYRAIKRRVRPMLGFKSFRSAAATLAGIELMHMIGKAR
jgi:transposase-like protein